METLRQKAELLCELGISVNYFRLLLKQTKITKKDKKYLEKLWDIVEDLKRN